VRELRLADAPRPLRLLCLGAHPDDIEIGCAGTIARLVAAEPAFALRWVVFSGDAARAEEARSSAAELLAALDDKHIAVKDFRDGFFPYDGARLKEEFERLKGEFDPTLILTHAAEDAHQDHRLVAELTRHTFRDHLILEYEVPKQDGDFGNPNLFVALSDAQARAKAAMLLRHFPSQRARRWFREETFLALMRLRGAFCGAASGFAEGFFCRRALLSL